jgi:hypothetical protein
MRQRFDATGRQKDVGGTMKAGQRTAIDSIGSRHCLSTAMRVPDALPVGGPLIDTSSNASKPGILAIGSGNHIVDGKTDS